MQECAQSHDHDHGSTYTRRLAWASLLLAALESAVSLTLAGAHLGNLSWLAFGFGSLAEMGSPAVVLWIGPRSNPTRMFWATRAIAVLFWVLALPAPLAALAGRDVEAPQSGWTLSIAVIFIAASWQLYRLKKADAVANHNDAELADSHLSRMCSLTGVIVVVASVLGVLSAWFPLAGGFLIAALMVYEGWYIWVKKSLCC